MMAKRKPSAKKENKNKQPASKEPVPKRDNLRETIESIVIALILAFLFQAFDAQAFEIPTGSMGPTLMGRHKDVVCPECGFAYQAGSSSEVNDASGELIKGMRVVETTCPNCRFTMPMDSDSVQGGEHRSYKGDRIWVSKAPYILGDPQRFDVAVFKFPDGAYENYIKRIVGLPGETLRIHHGNLSTRAAGEDEFTVARKPPHKVLAMMQPVFDSDHQPERLLEAGWPSRWQPDSDAAGGLTPVNGGRAFETDGTAPEEVWLRYRHIVPDREDWESLDEGRIGPDYLFPEPQLIADFCGYNSSAPDPQVRLPGDKHVSSPLGLHWVGDLIVSCELETASGSGQVTLELVKGGRTFRATIDLKSGQATLAIDGLESFAPRGPTPVRPFQTHEVMFANVDDQLLLWVDEVPVEFDKATTYGPLHNNRPTPADLAPVAIGALDADLSVSHLRVFRDIYSITGHREHVGGRRRTLITDYENNPWLRPNLTEPQIVEFLSSPEMWSAFDEMEPYDYALGDGEYFAMGDNSPNSSDARFWSGNRLPEELLIGKAFFIYWPHAWETQPSFKLPIPGREIRVPFYPNFERMRRIR